jgi:SNF2 family DNA or RNA helicase
MSYDLSIRKDGTLAVSEGRLSALNRWQHLNTLRKLRDETPVALLTEAASRQGMRDILLLSSEGEVQIEPLAKEAIVASLVQGDEFNAPLRPPTDQELVAYADEMGKLECVDGSSLNLTPGRGYDIRTGSTPFTEKFTRKKPYYDEDSGTMRVTEHTCELTGVDRFIRIVDDNNEYHFFRDRPGPHDNQHQEAELWEHFKRPDVDTIREVSEEKYDSNIEEMRAFEAMSGFTYFPGQLDYYARMGIKKYGCIAADVGTGKTLGALTLAWLAKAERILIMAPKGTVENEMGDKRNFDPAQWVAEIQKFCPYYPVRTLFNRSDYDKARSEGEDGVFPPGIYITYPSAFLKNDAMEYAPGTWRKANAVKREEQFRKRLAIRKKHREGDRLYHLGLGECDANGIVCVAKPSLSTLCGSQFDMIIIDEAHLMRSLKSMQTRALLRLQPEFRYTLSATPIPNQITNIFPILGWLAVRDWYKGGKRNAAFPYAISEYGSFEHQFMSVEYDSTEERRRRSEDPNWSGRIRSNSAVISSPTRLLKLIKPILGYISKEECNPDLVKCNVQDVRVPMGQEQMQLYAKYLNRKVFIPKDLPKREKKEKQRAMLTAALRQTNALRSICASPRDTFAGLREEDSEICTSNFNPKIITILQMLNENIDKGEQTVVVYSRTGQGNEIASRINQAGIRYGRIDSTRGKHAMQASQFKKKEFPILLMGINCAQAYSFENCPNLIVASLDWGYGSLYQALGRVHRLNSPKECNIHVILFENTIEEAIFDRVATKQDAATLCLHGKRVDRDYKQMEASEILADHIINFDENGESRPESSCELEWNTLAGVMKETNQNPTKL